MREPQSDSEMKPFMKKKKPFVWLTIGVYLTACISCHKENTVLTGTENEKYTFGYSLTDYGAESKTVLTTSGLEELITSISIAVYRDGLLVDTDYYQEDFSGMSFNLLKGGTYDIYAMANMGDMTGKMPLDNTSWPMEDISWTIPSYSYVNSSGLPMAGCIRNFVAGKDIPQIPLRRLFAKVSADISFAYDGASVSSIKIMNLNGLLHPLGDSAAASSSSLMSEVEYDSGTGTYVFYVPENMQGQIGSASESHGKNPDIDREINSKKDVLTYIEVEVSIDESEYYRGSVTYRSYLGNDSTRDFDVQGNCSYNWTIIYHENDLQYNDWKVDTGSLSSDAGLSFLAKPEWEDESYIEL